MKNQNYYVLKTVYKLSRKNNADFIPLKALLSKKCPDNVVTYLEFRNYLNYKRENKTDYYSITLKGIEYICKHKRDKCNIVMTVIAAITSIIGVITSLVGLYLSLSQLH